MALFCFRSDICYYNELVYKTENDVRDLDHRNKRITIQLRCIAGLFFQIIPAFMQSNQETGFNVIQNDNAGIDRNDYDLLLYPSVSPARSGPSETVFRENIFVAMREDHPLMSRTHLSPDELSFFPYIMDILRSFRNTPSPPQIWRGSSCVR